MTSIPLGGPVRNQIVPWKGLGEGDSEVTYFDELKRYLETVTFDTENAKGGDIANMQRLSEKKVKKGLKIVVMDVDKNRPEALKQFNDWCRRNNISLLISNPSFEVWLLMHFKNVASNMDQDDLENDLTAVLNRSYDKKKGIRPNRTMISSAVDRAREKIPRDADPFEYVLTHPGNTMMPLLFEIVGEEFVHS